MNDPVIRFLAVNAAVSLVLALVALGCGWGRGRPQIVHLLWLAALVNLITPSVVPIPVPVWPVPAAPASAVAAEIESISFALTSVPTSAAPVVAATVDLTGSAAAPSFENSEPPWRRWIFGLWATGSAGWAGLAMGRMVRFHRLLRHAELLDSRHPRVFAVDAPISPLLWAFLGRARIVVPKALFESLTVAERATLLRHERAHFRRRDHWVRWVEFVVLAVLWWHPLAWWASRRLRAAEEACCDSEVVAGMADRRPYATALVRTALFISETAVLPRVAIGIGSAASIQHRVHTIMHIPAPRRLSWHASFFLLSATAVVVLAAPVEKEPPAAEDPLASAPTPEPPPTAAAASEESAAKPSPEPFEDTASEAPSAPFEPERHYLAGYLKVAEGEKEHRAGNSVSANVLWQEALAIFKSIQAQAPEWLPAMVNYRLRLVRHQLALSPLSSLNGQFTISAFQNSPETLRRIALQSRLVDQSFAMVADRIEMVTPDGETYFDPGPTQFSRNSNRLDPGPTLTATGTVRGGWGPWRVIADRLELDGTGFTLTGYPVVLVDGSSDPPRRVFVGRQVSLDPMQRTLAVSGEVVALMDKTICKVERIDLNLLAEGTPFPVLSLEKGSMETISDRRLTSERALLLKTWPGHAVLEAELSPLLQPKEESNPPAPHLPPVDGPRQEPQPNENTAPKKLPG